jgi:hypothetical protein
VTEHVGHRFDVHPGLKPTDRFVLRQDASVVTDTSVYFTSDRVAVRATLRVSFGFTYPAAVVKVTITR